MVLGAALLSAPPATVRRTADGAASVTSYGGNVQQRRKESAVLKRLSLALPGNAERAADVSDKLLDGVTASVPKQQSEIAVATKRRAQNPHAKRQAEGVSGVSRARRTRTVPTSTTTTETNYDTGVALLTAAEEVALSVAIQELRRIESVRESLVETLPAELPYTGLDALARTLVQTTKSEPSTADWARACQLSISELQRRQAAGRHSRERLVRANMALVKQISMQWVGFGKMGLEDLVQEGATGLLRATELYDGSRGYRFSTYAHRWIESAVRRACQNLGRTIRVPVHVLTELPKLKAARKTLAEQLGRPPSSAELATKLGMSQSQVAALECACVSEWSLDAALTAGRGKGAGGETTSLGDMLASGAEDPQTAAGRDVELDMLQADMNALLRTLLPKERFVLRAHYGLNGKPPQSLRDIAQGVGVTVRAVEGLKTTALERLRSPSRSAFLQPFIDVSRQEEEEASEEVRGGSITFAAR